MVSHHATYSVFTHADVNNIGVAFGHCDRANRASLKITIRDVAPADTHVLRFPQPSAGGAHVIRLWITDHAAGRHGPAAAKWSNGAPLNCFEDGVVVISDRLGSVLAPQVAYAEAEDYQRK